MVEDKDSPLSQDEESETSPPVRITRLTRSLSASHSNGGSASSGGPSTSTGVGATASLNSNSNNSNNNNGTNPTTATNGEVTSWECSVCTYQNTEEEFKCAICESRKGTSTRKPRATSQTQVVQIQALAAEVAKQSNATLRKQRRRLLRQQQQQSSSSTSRNGRLKNVDRSRGTRTNVTVNNVTVVITDYPLKNELIRPASSASSSTTTPPLSTTPHETE